jgi:iron(III) transport system permease protein
LRQIAPYGRPVAPRAARRGAQPAAIGALRHAGARLSRRFGVEGPGAWALGSLVFFASLVIVGLLVFVAVTGFLRMENGDFAGIAGLRNYQALLRDPAFLSAISNTAKVATISLVVGFFFALPIAWLSERSDIPGRSLIWTGMLASTLLPGFVVAMGWIFLAHPRIGLLNVTLMGALNLTDAPFPITTVAGIGIVQGIALAPLIFILVAPSLRMTDPTLEEAAMMSGASLRGVSFRITLPLMLPAIAAAAIYTAINAVGAFDIPAIIGWSSRIYTFSTYLYLQVYPVQGFPDYGVTAAAGTLMMAAATILSILYARILRKGRQFQVVGGRGYRPRLVALGHFRVPAAIFVWFFLCLVSLIPFLMTVLLALLPYAQPLSLDVIGSLSFANFLLVPWDLVRRGALHTLELIVIVPATVVAISLAFSWVVLRSHFRFRNAVDAIAFLPHAVPAVLFAVAANLFALFILQKVIPIYGTIAMVAIVYIIGSIPFGSRMMNSSLIQVSRDLDEAAFVSGASFTQVLGRVLLPLLRPATSGLWLVGVLFCLRELTLAAFVTTPRNMTLPMVTWYFWQDGQLTHAAAVAVVVSAATAPLLFLFLRFSRRSGTALF